MGGNAEQTEPHSFISALQDLNLRRVDLQRERRAADQLTGLLASMEAPPIDEAACQRLQRLIYFHGPQHVTLLIRTIVESEGNECALVEPVISAVSSVMSSHRQWTERGLAWIGAFDSIPLLAIVETMRSLCSATIWMRRARQSG